MVGYKPGCLGLGEPNGGTQHNMTDADTPDARRKRAERLEIARRVYRALVAQAPDRVITLCDGRRKVVARHDLQPERDNQVLV